MKERGRRVLLVTKHDHVSGLFSSFRFILFLLFRLLFLPSFFLSFFFPFLLSALAESVKALFSGAGSAFIVTPGAEDRTKLTITAIDCAKQAAVTFVMVVSVLTAEHGNTVFGAQLGKVEAHLKESQLTYCLLRLPLFMDNLYGNAESVKKFNKYYGPCQPTMPFVQIAVSDAAQAGRP